MWVDLKKSMELQSTGKRSYIIGILIRHNLVDYHMYLSKCCGSYITLVWKDQYDNYYSMVTMYLNHQGWYTEGTIPIIHVPHSSFILLFQCK